MFSVHLCMPRWPIRLACLPIMLLCSKLWERSQFSAVCYAGRSRSALLSLCTLRAYFFMCIMSICNKTFCIIHPISLLFGWIKQNVLTLCDNKKGEKVPHSWSRINSTNDSFWRSTLPMKGHGKIFHPTPPGGPGGVPKCWFFDFFCYIPNWKNMTFFCTWDISH